MSQKASYDTNSSQYHMRLRFYDSIIRYQPDQQKRKQFQAYYQKFKQAKNAQTITSISKQCSKQIYKQLQSKIFILRQQCKYYKDAFEKITQKQQYKQCKKPDFNITQFLLQLQQKINVNELKRAYYIALLGKKNQYNWSIQFVKDLIALVQQKKLQEETAKKQKLQKKQMEKANIHRQNQQSAQMIQPAPKPQQKIKPSQKSTQKLPFERGQSSLQKVQKGSKKRIKTDQNNQQIQKKQSKQSQRQKQKDQDQSVSISQHLIKQQKKKNAIRQPIIQQPAEKAKQPKNRVNALRQYLQKRKDFANMNPNKLKQISQYLNQNLQKFMKYHLENLLDIVKLSHPKVIQMPEGGSQFTYFSPKVCNLKIPAQTKVSQDPGKIIQVNYRSKMELYSMLKVKENMLENNLLKKYASKKDDDKKGDKKLWQYLLRPNQHQKAQICIPEQSTQDRITIGLPHLRYLFQNHPFIRKSYLMMGSYI